MRWLNRSIYNVQAVSQQFAAEHPELQSQAQLIAKIIKQPLDLPSDLTYGIPWAEALRAIVFVTPTGLWIYPIKKFAAMHGSASGIEKTEPFWLDRQQIEAAQILHFRKGLSRANVLQLDYAQHSRYQFGLEYAANLAKLLPFEVRIVKSTLKHTTASIKARISLYATVMFIAWFVIWFGWMIGQGLFR
ncbi:hypothetical protein ACP8Y2_00825 [Herpetosiphon llansteffanensis]